MLVHARLSNVITHHAVLYAFEFFIFLLIKHLRKNANEPQIPAYDCLESFTAQLLLRNTPLSSPLKKLTRIKPSKEVSEGFLLAFH
jgi:hypothetical protein